MSIWLAIDPGPEQSAYVLYDGATGKPLSWLKDSNRGVLAGIRGLIVPVHYLAIEVVASYGMPVGAEVFETCVWVGRFIERWVDRSGREPVRVFRRDVKLHLCGSARATDATIRQALIDRYGPGKEAAVGRKASPGPLYGMHGDCWAALGVAVTASDRRRMSQALA